MNSSTVSTIVGKGGVKGTSDGIRSEAMLNNPFHVTFHHNTGVLFVGGEHKDQVRKVSKIKGDTGQFKWMVSSIFISLSGGNIAMAVFCDALFLLCWQFGTVIQISLTGGTTKTIGQLPDQILLRSVPHLLSFRPPALWIQVL